MNEAIAVLFLHTGLRVSELTTLKLINVDLDRDQIKITRKGNKEQYLPLNASKSPYTHFDTNSALTATVLVTLVSN